MAVFTEVSEAQASALLRELKLGELRELRGIQSGIENTNYFVTAEDMLGAREYVLTLFERLTAQQLPFYLHLMKHLAQHGIPVPDPQADRSGDILHTVCGKPAALVNKLAGRHELALAAPVLRTALLPGSPMAGELADLERTERHGGPGEP